MTIQEFDRGDVAAKLCENVEGMKLSKKQASYLIDKVVEAIVLVLKEGSEGCDGAKMTLRNFGTFATTIKQPRQVRNFHTNEVFMSKASRSVSFKFATYAKRIIKEIPVDADADAKKTKKGTK